jgi:hypothetical protein
VLQAIIPGVLTLSILMMLAVNGLSREWALPLTKTALVQHIRRAVKHSWGITARISSIYQVTQPHNMGTEKFSAAIHSTAAPDITGLIHSGSHAVA